MTDLAQRVKEKIKNDYLGKKISLVFDTLPSQDKWSSPLLDHSTKVFLSNLVTFLSQRSAGLQVSNETDSLINIITTKAWEKHQPQTGTLAQVSNDKLFIADAVVGIGLSPESLAKISSSKVPAIVIRTSYSETFPGNVVVIAEEPNYAISQVVVELNKLFDIKR